MMITVIPPPLASFLQAHPPPSSVIRTSDDVLITVSPGDPSMSSPGVTGTGSERNLPYCGSQTGIKPDRSVPSSLVYPTYYCISGLGFLGLYCGIERDWEEEEEGDR